MSQKISISSRQTVSGRFVHSQSETPSHVPAYYQWRPLFVLAFTQIIANLQDVRASALWRGSTRQAQSAFERSRCRQSTLRRVHGDSIACAFPAHGVSFAALIDAAFSLPISNSHAVRTIARAFDFGDFCFAPGIGPLWHVRYIMKIDVHRCASWTWRCQRRTGRSRALRFRCGCPCDAKSKFLPLRQHTQSSNKIHRSLIVRRWIAEVM
ncbi:hypothetical protein ACVJGD_008068 [Bradyrhizobium sp. USDA 10063]